MLSLNGISAWIEVDGKELEQYAVEDALDQSTVTCWIATQADKEFSVVFRDSAVHGQYSLGSSLQLDGSSIPGKVVRPKVGFGNFQNFGTARTVHHNDQVTSMTTSRPFKFSKLELTDEEEYLHQASAHLGEIQIQIYRVEILESHLFGAQFGVAGHGKIHERSKKAVTHCVSYGQEMMTATQYSTRVKYLDGRTPLATFIFKYRDFSLLQANGIIPKPPPTKQNLVFEEVLDLTIGDDVKSEPFNEEIEIIDNATRKRTAIFPSKRSNSSRKNEARPAKRIKREHKFVPSGEVIDLT